MSRLPELSHAELMERADRAVAESIRLKDVTAAGLQMAHEIVGRAYRSRAGEHRADLEARRAMMAEHTKTRG